MRQNYFILAGATVLVFAVAFTLAAGILISLYAGESMPQPRTLAAVYTDPIQPILICTDSDGGKDFYKAGTVNSGGVVYNDNCVSESIVHEWYCADNMAKFVTYDCGYHYHCDDGHCTPNVCSDSDGGLNYFSVGKVTYGATEITDSCVNASVVRENYCEKGIPGKSDYACPSGYACSSGRCVSVSCSDSDGNDIYKGGYVLYGGKREDDYCQSTSNVWEYTCDETGMVKTLRGCPAGYYCLNGACVQEDTCEDSDDGKDVYEKGTVDDDGKEYVDSCVDISTVKEYYCDGKSSAYRSIQCPTDYYCFSGACRKAYEECEDSDSGWDYAKRGTVYLTGPGSSASYTDTCVSSTTLKEYNCDTLKDGYGTMYSFREREIECADDEICRAGACIPESTYSDCIDSDGGVNPYVAGDVLKEDVNKMDFCASAGTVQEYYCLNNQIRYELVTCEAGFLCREGRCQSSQPCTDSDSGRDYYTAGAAAIGAYKQADACIGGSLQEYYCDERGAIRSETVQCNGSCEGGACVPQDSFKVELKEGWNLFAVPLTDIRKVDGDCALSLQAHYWWYDPKTASYTTSTLADGRGYWKKMLKACNATFYGTAPQKTVLELSKGWNMIGVSKQVRVSSLSTSCAIEKGPYYFDPAGSRYVRTDVLNPGKGYIVKVGQPCTYSTN